jgi:cytochrome c oxidase subunit 2
LSDGHIVIANDAYIRDCILQPTKNVPAGFEPLMPSFDGIVNDSDIIRLTAYIRSLKDQGKS